MKGFLEMLFQVKPAVVTKLSPLKYREFILGGIIYLDGHAQDSFALLGFCSSHQLIVNILCLCISKLIHRLGNKPGRQYADHRDAHRPRERASSDTGSVQGSD